MDKPLHKWTQVICAVSNIYFTKTEQHTQIRLNHWKNNFKKCFSNMWLKWWDSSNGHFECKCWHDSKTVTKHKKVLCVLDFHTTKFITIIQWGLHRSSIKKPPCTHSIYFLGCRCNFTAMSVSAFLVAIAGVT